MTTFTTIDSLALDHVLGGAAEGSAPRSIIDACSSFAAQEADRLSQRFQPAGSGGTESEQAAATLGPALNQACNALKDVGVLVQPSQVLR